MAEELNGGNGEQYVRYTTKELLREIANKLDRVEIKLDTEVAGIKSDINALDHRVTLIEAQGSPALAPKVAVLEREVAVLRGDKRTKETLKTYRNWLIATGLGCLGLAATIIFKVVELLL